MPKTKKTIKGLSRTRKSIKKNNKPVYFTLFVVAGISLFSVINFFYQTKVTDHGTNKTSHEVKGSSYSSLPSGYKVFFSDDFDGSSLDTSRWKAYYNVYGDSNNEEACLTPNNIVVSGGTMKIVSKRESIVCPNNKPRDFTSGFVGSREASRYYPVFARYEIRAKLPHGQGLWPAFWLRHVNGSSTAEIDVMEYFHAQIPGRVSQTIHFPAEQSANVFKKNTAFESPTVNPDWHTYGVEFVPLNAEKTQAKIVFYVDDVKTAEYTPTVFGWLNNFDKNAMFDIAINDAVGGNWNGHPDDELGWSRYLNRCLNVYNRQSPCNPTGGVMRATFPGTYEVDYVRVLTEDDTPPPSTPESPTNPSNPSNPPKSSTPDSSKSSNGDKQANKNDQQSNSNIGASSENVPETVRESSESFAPEIFKDTEKVSQIKTVEYLLDGKVIQVHTKPPYDLVTDDLPIGEHKITQRVTFQNGEVKENVKGISVKKKETNTSSSGVTDTKNDSKKHNIILGSVIGSALLIAVLGTIFRAKIKKILLKR